jgi:hypothetical protein
MVGYAAVGPAVGLIADLGPAPVIPTAILDMAMPGTAGMAPDPAINVSTGARQGTANVAAAAAVVALTASVSVDDLSV